ncbi:MAG: hypothetical protein JJ900_09915 [Rhodospirillales bacterium]|nr:hypothetical protein [Rhodospirillales bacterium]MBO6787155.1 hypothetical protein [Rhodospirillales bacterium]
MVTKAPNAYAVPALVVLIAALVAFAPGTPFAKPNPPGCKNPGAQVNNPNCTGGGDTHIPIIPIPRPTPIVTIPITPTVPVLPPAQVRPPIGIVPPPVQPVTPPIGTIPPPQQVRPPIGVIPPATGTTDSTATVTPPAGQPQRGAPRFADRDCTVTDQRAPCAGGATGAPGRAFVFELTDENAASGGVVDSGAPAIVSDDVTRTPELDALMAKTGSDDDVGIFDHIPNRAGAGRQGGKGGEAYGSILVHVQRHTGEPTYATHVPPKPGNNLVPGYRAFLVTDDGKASTCVLSGMGRRTVVNQSGQAISRGHTQAYRIRSFTAATLGANRPSGSYCLVSVGQ